MKIKNILSVLMVLTLSVSAGFANIAFAQKAIVQGVDYELLKNPLPPHTGANVSDKKVDVIEFFSLTCGHCYDFENILENWVRKNSTKINFVRSQYVYPGSGLGNTVLGEVYFTLEAMGLGDKMLIPAYKAIQMERVNFADQKQLDAWLTRNNVDTKTFAETRASFGIKTTMNIAQKRVTDAEVESTPQLIIDGKYRIIAQSSLERVLEVADGLVAKVQYEKNKNQPKTIPKPVETGKSVNPKK